MKPSTSIRPRQTREMLRAGRHAWKIGREINHFVVINFDCPEGDELKPQRQARSIRRKLQSWLYYKRKDQFMDPLTDIRTWENKGDRYHLNWAIHVPDQYVEEFRRKLPVWIKSVLGDVDDDVWKSTEIYNLNGLMRYMLKGTHQGKATRFGIRHSPQGKIWGRRAAAAICLGAAARKRDQEEGAIVEGREVKRV